MLTSEDFNHIETTIRNTLSTEAVQSTAFSHGQGTVTVLAKTVPAALEALRGEGYAFLSSVHGVDYYPQEPRFAVHYQLLNMQACKRVGVRVVLASEEPTVPSITPAWPTANHQEREVYDMFGVIFTGHPDLRRILMPEDYEGYPQRRDFPIGGEPVLFTYNEHETPRWYE